MGNYSLKKSWDRSNVQSNEWIAMEEDDKVTLAATEGIVFGDTVYILDTKKTYIRGNDEAWYEM